MRETGIWDEAVGEVENRVRDGMEQCMAERAAVFRAHDSAVVEVGIA